MMLQSTFHNRNKRLTKINYSSIGYVFKRHTSSIFNMFNKISPAALIEQRKLIMNKAIFLKYCNHFKQNTLTQLLNDSFFIQMMHKTIHEEPTLYSRAFQLALEVTYARRQFSQQALEDFYKSDFKIEDTFKVNQGLCDQSTLYTSIVTKFVLHNIPYSKDDIIVTSTPIFLTKEKITKDIQNRITYNKEMTDNSAPDLTIKGRPFDFKDTKHISYSKNHIYLIDEEHIQSMGSILKTLNNALTNSLKQPMLSNEVKLYTIDILEKLQKINTEILDPKEKLKELNAYLQMSPPPLKFKMPFFIPIKKANEDLLLKDIDSNTIKNIPLEQGHLDSTKTKKAIIGITQNWDYNLKLNIQKAVHNSLFILDNNELN